MQLESSGERTTTSTAIFGFPFSIGDDPTVMPAGAYVIHTRERSYARAHGTAFIAVSVEVEVQERPGSTSYRVVKPSHFETAVATDKVRASSSYR